jgi:hypothetical protein
MARPRLGNAEVLHARWAGTLQRSADIDRLFRSLALPMGGSLHHRSPTQSPGSTDRIGILTIKGLRAGSVPPEEAQPFLRDAQILLQGAGMVS